MKPVVDPDRERKLEEFIHRELGKLPEIPAPATLVPRVMAAIQHRIQRPWWRRSFGEWPCVIQAVFVAALMAGTGTLIWESATLWGYLNAQALTQEASRGVSLLDAFWSTIGILLFALRVAIRTLACQPITWAALFVLGLFYGSCVGAGTLCYRLVTKSQLQ